MNLNVWDLDAAWKDTCRAVMESGKDYKIDRGSYVGQIRRQLPYLSLIIDHPENRPLSPVCEQPVTNDRAIEQYFADYLINPSVSKHEQYTYASRIAPHLETVAEMLKDSQGTNQAVIEIARPEDIGLSDPPCLRCLGWNIINERLQLSSFWRSWDVHGALPVNLGGLQLLNEMIAEWIDAKSGRLVAYSSGAHIYEHVWHLLSI